MAEDASSTPTTQSEPLVQVQEVVVTDVPQLEKKEEPLKPVLEESADVSKDNNDDKQVPESGSFKEESTKVSDLNDNEKKALQELKSLIQQALNNHEFSHSPKESIDVPAKKEDDEEQKNKIEEETKPEEPKTEDTKPEEAKTEEPKTEEEEGDKKEIPPEEDKAAPAPAVDDDGAKTVEAIEETIVAVSTTVPAEHPPTVAAVAPPPETQEKAPPEEVSIWGIPLLADERTDVVLLKFLRARDFKVKDAFAMIKNTIRWRKEFGIEELIKEENLAGGEELEKAVYMQGIDKEGHPVCYNVYGEFQKKEVYKKAFSDEGKRQNFLRWRIQFLEKSIRKLDFNPGGISTIVQVNDLKNSPGPGKWELRQATKQALQLLQDNYPEFVAKQVFINVPWWYMAVNRMISPFLTQRTKSKMVFAGPSKSAETLLRYIAPEQLPVKYGGLSKEGEFGNADAVTEITVRPAAKHTVEFPVNEKCLLSWEVRVIGWDVSYGAEFVPSGEGSYTVIIQKARKVASSEEPVISNSFQIGEPGKVVLTIDNQSSKKKKLLYRLKTKPSA